MGARKQPSALWKASVCTGCVHDGPDGAYDEVRLPAEPLLDEVIAADGDDVDVVGGERRKLVLHRAPQPIQRPRELP